MMTTCRFVAMILVVGACTPVVDAVEKAAVEKWLNQSLALNETAPIPENTKVLFDFVTRSVMSPTDFSALEKRVGNKPDHPDRPQLEMERVKRSPEGMVENKQIWYSSPAIWRSAGGAAGTYMDFGRNEGDQWSLSPQRFVATVPGATPVAGHDIAVAFAMELEALDFLLSGGLREAVRLQQSLDAVDLVDGKWLATLKRADGSRARRLQIEWDEVANRGFVMSNIRLDKAGKELGGWTMSGWKERLPGFWSASSARSDGKWGSGIFEYQFRDAVTLDRQEVVAVAKLPAEGTPDPIRGSLTFRTFLDARNGPSMTVSKRTVQDKFDEPLDAPSNRLRWLGWGIGACALVVVLVVWFRLRWSKH